MSAIQSAQRVDVFGRVYADVWRVAPQSISAQNSFQPSGSSTRIRSTQTAVASWKVDMRLAAIIVHVNVMLLRESGIRQVYSAYNLRFFILSPGGTVYKQTLIDATLETGKMG